jgi:predicted PurR-regulated permease PerM
VKKLLGIVVLGLLWSGTAYARRYGDGDTGGLLIYALALLAIFGIGALISPIWELGTKTKKIETTIYDRENPSHANLFKGYPKFKGRYIEVPISQIEKDKFWKEFRKKYFK